MMRDWGLFSLENTWGDLWQAFPYVAEKVEPGSLESGMAGVRETMVMRDYGYELEEDRFRPEVRKRLFIIMTVKP